MPRYASAKLASPRGAAALLFAGLLLALPAAEGAGKLVEGPWFHARVGTRIVYRVSNPSPTPGGKIAVRTMTEEAIAVSDTEVTLRVTRKAAGQADQVSTRKVARRISNEEYSTVFHALGFVRTSPPLKVCGHTFACSAFEKDIEVEADHTVRRYTTMCRDLPGWIHHSTISLSSGTVELHQILEYKP